MINKLKKIFFFFWISKPKNKNKIIFFLKGYTVAKGDVK
jgi:hypothetical protein